MEYQVVEESALVGGKSFLSNPVDGHFRVWRPRNTTFQQEHIVGTTAFGGGGFTGWGYFSLNCKIDLYVFDGTLTGQKYRDQILPHFDGHPLASRPMLMDGNTRPHNPYSARLSATGGNRATTLVSHVTGYESDKAFMRLSRTKSERTYPVVSKHSGIRDCFGSGMATVPSTQIETLDSQNWQTFSGAVQDARRLYSLLTLS